MSAIRDMYVMSTAHSLRVQSGVVANSSEMPYEDAPGEVRYVVLGHEGSGRSKLSPIVHITCLRFQYYRLRINLPLGDAAVFEGPHSHPSHIAERGQRDGTILWENGAQRG